MLFQDAIVNDNLGGDSAMLYAYGIYLANGGTRDGFLDMSMEDVQVMLMAYTGSQLKDHLALARILSKLFGGDSND